MRLQFEVAWYRFGPLSKVRDQQCDLSGVSIYLQLELVFGAGRAHHPQAAVAGCHVALDTWYVANQQQQQEQEKRCCQCIEA